MTTVAIGVDAVSVRYGGFWRRWVAFVVDRFLLGLVVAPVVFLFIGPMVHFGQLLEDPDGVIPFLASMIGVLVFVVPVVVALQWLYYALLQSSTRQATLGQMLMGLKVTDLEGRRISFARATGRLFAHVLTGLTIGIGYLMVVFTRRKQALHDMIAGTLVVRT
jgi:uncharacterized RDD family membrane protein YckC